MTKRILVTTVLAILCAGSTTATVARSENAGLPAAHALRFTHHQNFAAMHAAVSEPPTVFPSRRPQPYPYNFHETDGLSRNPNDCAVWGCIDSN
jgi:hypothetical protein